MSRGFRLAGLLRLRRLQEEQAAAVLARANAEAARAGREHAEIRTVMAETLLPARADGGAWAAAVADRAAVASMVTEAALVAEVATRRGELAAGEWTAARTTVATLDKLGERHESVVRAEDERAEQLVLDEAAARRHEEDR